MTLYTSQRPAPIASIMNKPIMTIDLTSADLKGGCLGMKNNFITSSSKVIK
jgi:hypothetical protein